MIPVDQSPGMFAVLVHLPPGCVVHQRVSGLAKLFEIECCCAGAVMLQSVFCTGTSVHHDHSALLFRYHQYKFIVDGEWRHDETQPSMPDPLGNVNNWLYVRQPDAAGYVPSIEVAVNREFQQ